jgi:hypothetical protein
MSAESLEGRSPPVVRPRVFHSSFKPMKTKSAPLIAWVFGVLVVVADAAREVVCVILITFVTDQWNYAGILMVSTPYTLSIP